MNDYMQVRLDMTPCFEDATDLMAGMLADIGYESFVADENGLTAYIQSGLFNLGNLFEVVDDFPFDCKVSESHDLVEGRDWNREWELNYFKPIVVGDQCVIHSSFHTNVPSARYDIVIDPKMAFGTGHHATTSQVIEALLDTDLSGKTMIDMGTGTAILAILASMLGASKITGIEIDSFAYENALENVRLNGCDNVKLINGDACALKMLDSADVFVANINRNVIVADIASYAAALKNGGVMLLSGFYVEDIPVIENAAASHGLKMCKYSERDRWVCVRMVKE